MATHFNRSGHCKKLCELCLIDFKPDKDLSKISLVISLKKLTIKSSSGITLKRIEKLINLKEILLANCRKLTSLEPLNGLQHLESFDLAALKYLSTLKKLYLIDCGKIPSLEFIQNFSKLTGFGMPGILKWRMAT